MTARALARKVARDLRAHRAQALALAAVVALGITSFVALVGAYLDLSASLTRTSETLRLADAWIALADAPASVAAEVRDVPGVDAVEARLVIDAGLQLDRGVQARARIVSVPDGRRPVVNDVFLEAGRRTRGGRGVLVEADFAAARSVRPGETVSLLVGGPPIPRTVTGLITSPEYLSPTPSRHELLPSPSSFAVVFMPLADVQASFGRSGRVNEVALRVAAGADAGAVAAAVAERLAPYGPSAPLLREDQASYAAVQQDLAAFRGIATAMPSIILLAGAMSVAAMLARLVRSQQQHVGLMKALGYRDRAVAGHYVGFALAVTVAGALAGVIAGSFLARGVITAYAHEIGIPLLRTGLHPGVGAIAVALTIGLGLLAALVPARRAAAMAPAAAMRLDPMASAAAAGKPIGRLRPLPLGWRLPIRAVLRARRRTLSTGLGVVCALVLILMVLGLRDGAALLLDRVFVDVERWDVSATFGEPQPRAIAAEVTSWEGVREVAPFIQLPVSVVGPDGEKTALLTALEPDQRMHILQLPHGTTPAQALGRGSVVLSPRLARDIGADLDDRVTVRTPFGRRSLRFSSTSDEVVPTLAYVSLADVPRVSGTRPDVINGLYLSVEDGHAASIQARLYGLPGAASVKLLAELESDVRAQLALLDVIVGVMLAFAAAMAAALLFNAMTINVLERQREYGTMRAVGARPRFIASLFAAESAILWALCLVPGVLVGTWVAGRLGEAVAAGFFTFPVRITAVSYVSAAGGVLVAMLVAAAPAVRRVNRLDLARATKVLA